MTSDRDRMIELLHKAEDICDSTLDCDTCKYVLSGSCKTVLIADYLLANGVIVLPLPIGSTVFEIRARGKRRALCGMRKVDFSIVNNMYFRSAKDHRLEFYVKAKKFVKYDKTRWNKTVFLTKEEAEQALAERSGDNA